MTNDLLTRLKAIFALHRAVEGEESFALTTHAPDLIAITWPELIEAAERAEVLEGAFKDIAENRWNYWPPRKGEVHCKWCGLRTWASDIDKDEKHEATCPVILARDLLNEHEGRSNTP